MVKVIISIEDKKGKGISVDYKIAREIRTYTISELQSAKNSAMRSNHI